MKEIKKMNRLELAAYICTHLQKHGIEITLTGGSCESIYSQNQYTSMDLDFVESITSKRKFLTECLKEIGFYEENRYFKHQETDLFVEFPPGPLAIGSEPVKEIITIEAPTGKLRLISPTECVKDRLAGYYFWNDLQSLDQAILVSKSNEIDISEIKRWSEKEKELEKFEAYINELRLTE